MIAKGGMRGLRFFLSLFHLLIAVMKQPSLRKSQDKYLGFLSLEGVTHLFSTASPFPLLRIQELLMWTRGFQRQASPQKSKSREFFLGMMSPKCMRSGSVCVTSGRAWACSDGAPGLETWEGTSVGWLACRKVTVHIGATCSIALWESNYKLTAHRSFPDS